MYATVGKYLSCGDIFYEVPIPVLSDGAFATDLGPAMLIDGDCTICKKDPNRGLNLAPLFPLEVFDKGNQGNARNGIVRHAFYLPPHEALEEEEFVVDLSALFSLPRSYFGVALVELEDDGSQARWEVQGSVRLRAVTLDDVGKRALKDHMTRFFELRKKKEGEQPTLTAS